MPQIKIKPVIETKSTKETFIKIHIFRKHRCYIHVLLFIEPPENGNVNFRLFSNSIVRLSYHSPKVPLRAFFEVAGIPAFKINHIFNYVWLSLFKHVLYIAQVGP